MPGADAPEHPDFHGPPKPTDHISDGKPNPFYAAHAKRIAQLREVCVVGFFGQRSELLEEAEWRSLPYMLRFFVLTDAGLCDPDGAMRRNWREYPEAERHAIRATLRAWIRELCALGSLTR